MASQHLEAHCAWKVGNRYSIKASTQAWINGKIPIFRDCITLREAANTTIANLLLLVGYGWDVRKINNLFTPADALIIQGIDLPSHPDVVDTPYWPFTRSEDYSTESGYGLLLQHQHKEICRMTPSVNTKFFHQPQGLNIMPKWKIFIWKLWHNCLATSSSLHHRGIPISAYCLTCVHDEKDAYHILRLSPLLLKLGKPLTFNYRARFLPYSPYHLGLNFGLASLQRKMATVVQIT